MINAIPYGSDKKKGADVQADPEPDCTKDGEDSRTRAKDFFRRHAKQFALHLDSARKA